MALQHVRPKHSEWLLAAAGAGACVLILRAVMRSSRWFSYRGKRVFVTGGSRGLGLVLARQLARRGARVAICGRSQTSLNAAEEQIRAFGEVLALRGDISDEHDVERMSSAAAGRWGAIDIVINNAGEIQVGPQQAMTPEDFHRLMAIHCWGALRLIEAALPGMRRQAWGRIVNIASIGGKVPAPHLLPYTVSKFALVGLSEGLRAELAKENILVTTVCPGLMRTGSPRNAFFKGQHRAEYAWFSISDSLPFLSMDAERAAQRILAACQHGDAELILGIPAKLAALAHGIAPGLTAELIALADRLLPAMGGTGLQAVRGYESESAASTSLFMELTEDAARRNNEL